jgi:signal peptidase I
LEAFTDKSANPAAPGQTFASQLVSTLLHQVGEARLRVAGTSMLPTIQPSDVLCVRAIDPTQVAVGDIVLVGRHPRLCAHRVVDSIQTPDGPVLITRGDALTHNDPPVTRSLLLGRVEGLLRNGLAIGVRPAPRLRWPMMRRLLFQTLATVRHLAHSLWSSWRAQDF